LENEVEIGFAGYGDVERFGGLDWEVGVHGKASYCFVAYR
jgi:hypothetical protein